MHTRSDPSQDALEPIDERAPPIDQTATLEQNADHLRRVAHELLSPLTTLRLALQMGRTKLQRGEPLELGTIDRALRQVDELVALITQMRDAARLARADVESMPLERVDLRSLLQWETERLTHRHEERSFSFECETNTPVRIRADRRGIEQVITNLLDNACKFSARSSPIRIVMSTSGGDVVFSVTDQGIGIPPSVRDRVFEMFFRAPNAGSSSTHGVGLGLFIAREIVIRHGGRIWYDSELDRGSTFHVALPCCLAD